MSDLAIRIACALASFLVPMAIAVVSALRAARRISEEQKKDRATRWNHCDGQEISLPGHPGSHRP